jgi:hypothetical protein
MKETLRESAEDGFEYTPGLGRSRVVEAIPFSAVPSTLEL